MASNKKVISIIGGLAIVAAIVVLAFNPNFGQFKGALNTLSNDINEEYWLRDCDNTQLLGLGTVNTQTDLTRNIINQFYSGTHSSEEENRLRSSERRILNDLTNPDDEFTYCILLEQDGIYEFELGDQIDLNRLGRFMKSNTDSDIVNLTIAGGDIHGADATSQYTTVQGRSTFLVTSEFDENALIKYDAVGGDSNNIFNKVVISNIDFDGGNINKNVKAIDIDRSTNWNTFVDVTISGNSFSNFAGTYVSVSNIQAQLSDPAPSVKIANNIFDDSSTTNIKRNEKIINLDSNTNILVDSNVFVVGDDNRKERIYIKRSNYEKISTSRFGNEIIENPQTDATDQIIIRNNIFSSLDERDIDINEILFNFDSEVASARPFLKIHNNTFFNVNPGPQDTNIGIHTNTSLSNIRLEAFNNLLNGPIKFTQRGAVYEQVTDPHTFATQNLNTNPTSSCGQREVIIYKNTVEQSLADYTNLYPTNSTLNTHCTATGQIKILKDNPREQEIENIFDVRTIIDNASTNPEDYQLTVTLSNEDLTSNNFTTGEVDRSLEGAEATEHITPVSIALDFGSTNNTNTSFVSKIGNFTFNVQDILGNDYDRRNGQKDNLLPGAITVPKPAPEAEADEELVIFTLSPISTTFVEYAQDLIQEEGENAIVCEVYKNNQATIQSVMDDGFDKYTDSFNQFESRKFFFHGLFLAAAIVDFEQELGKISPESIDRLPDFPEGFTADNFEDAYENWVRWFNEVRTTFECDTTETTDIKTKDFRVFPEIDINIPNSVDQADYQKHTNLDNTTDIPSNMTDGAQFKFTIPSSELIDGETVSARVEIRKSIDAKAVFYFDNFNLDEEQTITWDAQTCGDYTESESAGIDKTATTNCNTGNYIFRVFLIDGDNPEVRKDARFEITSTADLACDLSGESSFTLTETNTVYNFNYTASSPSNAYSSTNSTISVFDQEGNQVVNILDNTPSTLPFAGSQTWSPGSTLTSGEYEIRLDAISGSEACSDVIEIDVTTDIDACIEAGGSLGAVNPDNNAVCCSGLVATPPPTDVLGSRGTCEAPEGSELTCELTTDSISYQAGDEVSMDYLLSVADGVEGQYTIDLYTQDDLENPIQRIFESTEVVTDTTGPLTQTWTIPADQAFGNYVIKLNGNSGDTISCESSAEITVEDNNAFIHLELSDDNFQIREEEVSALVTVDEDLEKIIVNAYRVINDEVVRDPVATLFHKCTENNVADDCAIPADEYDIIWDGKGKNGYIEPGSYLIMAIGWTDRDDNDTKQRAVDKILSAFGPDVPSQCQFSDVSPDDPDFDAILWTCKQGLFQGSGGRLFPDEKLKRIESVAVSNRAAGCTFPGSYNPSFDGDLGFSDMTQFLNRPATLWMFVEAKKGLFDCVTTGIPTIQGYGDGTFRPINTVQFFEFAKISLISFQNGGQANYLLSPDYNKNPWYEDIRLFLLDRGIPMLPADAQMTRRDAINFVYNLNASGLIGELIPLPLPTEFIPIDAPEDIVDL